jgi:hypothetical protein
VDVQASSQECGIWFLTAGSEATPTEIYVLGTGRGAGANNNLILRT